MTIMIVVFHLELMTIHLFKFTEVQEQGYFALFALLPLAAFLVFCFLFVFVFYLTIRLQARVFYEQIVNEAQPS